MQIRLAAITGNAEHFLVLLLIELTLYVTPCTMEMPALLAALLHDSVAQHVHEYPVSRIPETTDALLPPPNVDETTINEVSAGMRSESAKNERLVSNDMLSPSVFATTDAPFQLETNIAQQQQQLEHASNGANRGDQRFSSASTATSSSSFARKPLNVVQSALTPVTTTPRYCSIEISNRIPGICEPVAPIGSACVSGDYMDLFNLECM